MDKLRSDPTIAALPRLDTQGLFDAFVNQAKLNSAATESMILVVDDAKLPDMAEMLTRHPEVTLLPASQAKDQLSPEQYASYEQQKQADAWTKDQPVLVQVAEELRRAKRLVFAGPSRQLGKTIGLSALAAAAASTGMPLSDFGNYTLPPTPKHLPRLGPSLGVFSEVGVPFADSRGRQYIRDQKGVIRRYTPGMENTICKDPPKP